MSDRPVVLTLPELVAHGQHVNPAYEGGASGQATPEDRPEAAVHGTLASFDKDQSASATVHAYGWIKTTYLDAIEYAGQKQALEGGIMVGTFFILPLIATGLGMMGWLALLKNDWFVWALFLCTAPIFLAVAYWALFFPLRHVWRTPGDLPIIFDRANRKVYRMAQQRVG